MKKIKIKFLLALLLQSIVIVDGFTLIHLGELLLLLQNLQEMLVVLALNQ